MADYKKLKVKVFRLAYIFYFLDKALAKVNLFRAYRKIIRQELVFEKIQTAFYLNLSLNFMALLFYNFPMAASVGTDATEKAGIF